MNNHESLREFLKQCSIEQHLLIRCKNNEDFIQSISSRVIPFFETNSITKGFIERLNKELEMERNLRASACRELADAVEEIRKLSKDNKRTLNELESLLEEVKKEGNCSHLDDIPVFWDDYNEVHIYDKLRSLYCFHTSYHKLTFAPSAFRFTVESYCSSPPLLTRNWPLSGWNKLLFLDKCWSYRNCDNNNNWYSKSDGNGRTLFLEVDEKQWLAYTKMIGNKLKFVDTPNFDEKHFDRKYFLSLIFELFKTAFEFNFPDALFEIKPLAKCVLDKYLAQDFARKYWQRCASAKHDDVVAAIKRNIAFERQIPYEDSTLRAWIREIDPRDVKPRGLGKKG